MKVVKFFLILSALLTACQKQEEEVLDIDKMAYAEEEIGADHLAGEPRENPQERLISESASLQ